jgi:hypothetical protein
MSLSNIKSALLTGIALLLFTTGLSAEISESELEKLSSSIMKKIVSDNENDRSAIREYLNGVVVGNNSGMKLINKLALFVLNSNRNGVKLHKTLFFQSKEDTFILLMVFNDEEKEEYLLHLEYSFEKRRKVCTLKDVYFSLVFGEKKEQVDNFFRFR